MWLLFRFWANLKVDYTAEINEDKGKAFFGLSGVFGVSDFITWKESAALQQVSAGPVAGYAKHREGSLAVQL
jgi:hypothetical protein